MLKVHVQATGGPNPLYVPLLEYAKAYNPLEKLGCRIWHVLLRVLRLSSIAWVHFVVYQKVDKGDSSRSWAADRVQALCWLFCFVPGEKQHWLSASAEGSRCTVACCPLEGCRKSLCFRLCHAMFWFAAWNCFIRNKAEQVFENEL